MPSDPDLYDYLANVQISGVTVTQLNSATKSTFANRSNLEFWKGPITIARLLESNRTYSHGLAIPELGAVAANSIDSMQSADVRPTGSEIWMIEAVSTDNDISISLNDGSNTATLQGTSSTPFVPANLFITNSLYLTLGNGGPGTAETSVAYHKVGL